MKFKCKVITRSSRNEITGIENLSRLKLDFEDKFSSLRGNLRLGTAAKKKALRAFSPQSLKQETAAKQRSKLNFENETRQADLPELKVYLTAAPTKGKANEALINLLSEKLGLNKSKITIVKGEKSNKKVIEIEGIENDFKLPTV